MIHTEDEKTFGDTNLTNERLWLDGIHWQMRTIPLNGIDEDHRMYEDHWMKEDHWQSRAIRWMRSIEWMEIIDELTDKSQ